MPISLGEFQTGTEAVKVEIEQVIQPGQAYSTKEFAEAAKLSTAAALNRLKRAEKAGKLVRKKVSGKTYWAMSQ